MAGRLRRARLVDEVAHQAPERRAVGVALAEVERAGACAMENPNAFICSRLWLCTLIFKSHSV